MAPVLDGSRRDVRSAPLEFYWEWVAAVCYLLFTVDLLTTFYAAAVVGIGAEANPLVARAFAQGPLVLVAVNLAGLVVVVACFYALRRTITHTPARLRPYYAQLVGAFIGALVLVGLAVFANNLSVIVFRQSLVPA